PARRPQLTGPSSPTGHGAARVGTRHTSLIAGRTAQPVDIGRHRRLGHSWCGRPTRPVRSNVSSPQAARSTGSDSALRRQVMRKVAWRLSPFLGLLYFINYLDRTNISFAAPHGM